MFFLSEFEQQAFYLSFKVACFCVLWGLPLSLVIAWVLSRYNFVGKQLISGIIHLPLILPPVVIGYLLILLLGKKGLIGSFLYEAFDIRIAFTWKAAVIASITVSLPLMVRSIQTSISYVDQRFEQVAKSLGASSIDTFFTVTLPLILPGILSAIVLGFARSIGEFGATITFAANIPGESQTLPLALYSVIQTPGQELQAQRLLVLSCFLAFTALFLSEFMTKRFSKKMGIQK